MLAWIAGVIRDVAWSDSMSCVVVNIVIIQYDFSCIYLLRECGRNNCLLQPMPDARTD